MPRMNILNKGEQETFDTPPVFNSVERKRFFNLPQSLQNKAIQRFHQNPIGRYVPLWDLTPKVENRYVLHILKSAIVVDVEYQIFFYLVEN